ncbi:predicted protein [Nematostella vectensis]|uniref:Spindle and centriole-associated protein 1 n=1 Tax=Nematostella vectensis TaxID=45351 RepID=A7RJY6_NEMVE|nr:predicted protein [Nematostella vectensis]|eukprot:XP_001640231.1 predicted protein [Nematostella vectensis]
MASRGGFLVGDGALRRRKPTQKTTNTALKAHKTTKRKKRKPEWDSTVNDLNVYKASEDEVRQRHEAHKSKNYGLPRKQATNKENSPGYITTPNSAQRKQAILQEILYGRDQFQDVLAESDRTMSVVKDLFGDDPKKYMGFPNITVPPQVLSENTERNGPIAEVPEAQTQLTQLSESVMQTAALNEISEDEGNSSGTEPSPQSNQNQAAQRMTFQPRLDLQKFKEFVSQEQNDSGQPSYEVKNPISASRSQGIPRGKVLQPAVQAEDHSSFLSGTSGNTILAGAPNFMFPAQQSSGEPTAIAEIPGSERLEQAGEVKARVKSNEKAPKLKATVKPAQGPKGLRCLDDLKKMVENLEDEIAEYEMETGRESSGKTNQTNSFSGYTSALVIAVTKLMRYLKESEIQRRAEAVIRDQILQGFAEQRTLIDALTNDIVQTQEQNMILQEEMHVYRTNTDNQLHYLTHELQTVLKSFEYHTVQSTINALHSTKPVQLHAGTSATKCDEVLPGNYLPSGENPVVSRVQTEGAYIPVSRDGYDEEQFNLPRGETEKNIQPQPTVLSNANQKGPTNLESVHQQIKNPTYQTIPEPDAWVPSHQQQIEKPPFQTRPELDPLITQHMHIDNATKNITPQPENNQLPGSIAAPQQQKFAPSYQSNVSVATSQPPQPMSQRADPHRTQPSVDGASYVTFDHNNNVRLQSMDPFNPQAYLAPVTSVGVLGVSNFQKHNTANTRNKEQPMNHVSLGYQKAPKGSSFDSSAPLSSTNGTSYHGGKPSKNTVNMQPYLAPVWGSNTNTTTTTSPNMSLTNYISSVSTKTVITSDDYSRTTRPESTVMTQGTSQQTLSQPVVSSTENGPLTYPNNELSQSLLKDAVAKMTNSDWDSRREESFIARSFLKEQQATEQLRQRLEVIARKQKDIAATRAGLATRGEPE